MLRYLLLALLALPFIDILVLIEISSAIGFWRTVALILVTGVIGAEIARREIRFVLSKLGSSVTLREVSRNFLETTILLAAGLMLISPGIVTDLIGVSLAFRPFRERLVVKLAERLKEKGNFEVEVKRF